MEGFQNIIKDIYTIKFARVRDTGIIPSRREEDGGYDIYVDTPDDIVINPGSTKYLPSGIASAFDSQYRVRLQERGSTSKIPISLRAGLIDSGYRGEWMIAVQNVGDAPVVITPKTDRIYQDVEGTYFYPTSKALVQACLELVPVADVAEIPYEELVRIPSERGTGKLGSSGK